MQKTRNKRQVHRPVKIVMKTKDYLGDRSGWGTFTMEKYICYDGDYEDKTRCPYYLQTVEVWHTDDIQYFLDRGYYLNNIKFSK